MRSDVVDAATRSRMMAGIRGRNTRPEMTMRRGLHRLGFRFRIDDRRLPGRPDIVLPRWRATIFMHGCFWHGHDCALFKWPKSRQEFWRAKIEGNRARDVVVTKRLAEEGWRVLCVWECAMKGPFRIGADAMINGAAEWIRSDAATGEIRGQDGNHGHL